MSKHKLKIVAYHRHGVVCSGCGKRSQHLYRKPEMDWRIKPKCVKCIKELKKNAHIR